MSTDKIENKDKAEQKVSKDELSENELDKAAGGSTTFSYGTVKTNYQQQDKAGNP